MVRKWSYLESFSLHNTFFYKKENIISWYYPYKAFKRSVKFRKKNLCFSVITKFKKKRLFVRKARKKSSYFKVLPIKDWSHSYQKSRQFWRFYQSFGLLIHSGPAGFTKTIIPMSLDNKVSVAYSYLSVSSNIINSTKSQSLYYLNNPLFFSLFKSKHFSMGMRFNIKSVSKDYVGMPLIQSNSLFYNIETLNLSNIDINKNELISVINLILKLYLLNTVEYYKTFIKILLPFISLK